MRASKGKKQITVLAIMMPTNHSDDQHGTITLRVQ